MKQLFKDITTCKDGESFDVVRVAMTIIIFLLPIILIWGLALETWAVLNQKPFDIPAFFTAVLEFLTGSGTFLMSGSAALHFKSGTEPNNVTEPAEKPIVKP